MKIDFKKIFKLVDNGDLTQNLHSLCYQNNRLISEFDLGDVEDILVQLKKQQEIINKVSTRLEYFLIGNLKYQSSQEEFIKLLNILEDKEV